MKILVQYDYPPSPGGLSTQGHLLYRGLQSLGVEVHAAGFENTLEKEWYYHWFEPDVVVGVGYWGHTPDLVLHPRQHGRLPVPWLVADGYVANYQDVLESLPLVLVTSHWVKDLYIRDGLSGDNIEVLPVGCDTDAFVPRAPDDPKVALLRHQLGVRPGESMILTVGGDAASKGGQEVMQGLARIGQKHDWKYVCKVWPQPRTEAQNLVDLRLAQDLGIADQVIFSTNRSSRNLLPYLVNACDIYAAPSRLEGFGMPQVEAGACGKPVLGVRAMGMLDTLVHEETALLAEVATEINICEAVLGPESGFPEGHRVRFDKPRPADYRASVFDITEHLERLLSDPELRERLGAAGRERVVKRFDYRVVARRFLDLLTSRLGLT